MKYLIVLLCNSSVEFCHYNAPLSLSKKIIELDILKKGLLWGIKEGLDIQVIYPNYALPEEYLSVLGSIQHMGIYPETASVSDTIVLRDLDSLTKSKRYENPVILRTEISEFIEKRWLLAENLKKYNRVNIIFTDIENFSDSYIEVYEESLILLSRKLLELYLNDRYVQLNLVTDRLMLTEMNNCGAGSDSITLAPDGKFYICPGFYYDAFGTIGSPDMGLRILNSDLYKLTHAPICRQCDAFQCHRCVWLNKRTTLEINTPSYQQCVMAHIERKVASVLLKELRRFGNFAPGISIPEIDYLDPLEKIIKNK